MTSRSCFATLMRTAPPEPILRAALRWMTLLQTSRPDEATTVLRSTATFADLTWTQYTAAHDWLRDGGLLARSPLAPGERILSRLLDSSRPPWLLSADFRFSEPEDLPIDVLAAADTLQVTPQAAFRSAVQVQRRFDDTFRKEFGLNAERAVIELLEHAWPGRVRHRSIDDDTLGYDAEVDTATGSWCVEIKAAALRAGRRFFLSRNEFDTAMRNQRWLLVLVRLDANEVTEAAVIPTGWIADSAPDDGTAGQWESAQFRYPSVEPVSTLLDVLGPPAGRPTDRCMRLLGVPGLVS
jgi:hypothetical protein